MDINKVIEALKKGNTIKTKAGSEFFMDESGKIVDKKGVCDFMKICCVATIKHIDDFQELFDLDCEAIYPQVLDGAERRYLRNLVRPFMKRNPIIVKQNCTCLKERLYIYFDDGEDCMYTPSFNVNEMYKGMELNKKYTPEELSL